MAGELFRERALLKKLLQELSERLDIDSAARAVGIRGEEARALLLSLLKAPAKKVAVPSGTRVIGTGNYVVHVDGGSRGNPGPSGAGAVIRDPSGKVVRRLAKYLGVATNNVAEYEALILALEEAASISDLDSLTVYADSQLMVRQIKGEYRVKNEALKGLYAIAIKLVESFQDFEIRHIPREENSDADKLANEAMDKG